MVLSPVFVTQETGEGIELVEMCTEDTGTVMGTLSRGGTSILDWKCSVRDTRRVRIVSKCICNASSIKLHSGSVTVSCVSMV